MLRSFFAGTALATTVLVVLPFAAASNAETGSMASGGVSAPVVTIAEVDSSDVSRLPLAVLAQRRVGVDPEAVNDAIDRDGLESTQDDSEADAGSETEGAAPASEGTTDGSTGGNTGTSGSGSSGSGSSGSGSSGSGSSGSGSSGGGSAAPAPAPAPPAPPPAPEPPACPSNVGGSTPGAPSRSSGLGVAGTTSGDLADFAAAYNRIRVANCLAPIPLSNIRYDSCMEDRLFWMAEDPSSDPASAWGHKGQAKRSDGVADTGCDGNLAGGSGMTGAGAAQRWWDSSGHRASLYKPGASTSGVCILFAMTHGGVPNEPYSFARAAARWVNC